MSDASTSVLCAGAEAHPNIALIKYWGKSSDLSLNEPAVSSLSVTLDKLVTRTRLTFDPALDSDELILNGKPDSAKLPRISSGLDKMRAIAGIATPCCVVSENNFPTGAGLASSASGFAALVGAGDRALSLGLSVRQKSMLARTMSGSAARSIDGGFVKISLDSKAHADPVFGKTYAEQFADRHHWLLEVCVGIVSEKEKAVGSTAGMECSRVTSPYYQAWLAGNDRDIVEAEAAIMQRDFEKLADVSEFSCLKMHALAQASRPGLLYWHGTTVDAMHCIHDLRRQGIPTFFTIDAGPQIKAICAPGVGDVVAQSLMEIPGIQRVIQCGLGDGLRVSD